MENWIHIYVSTIEESHKIQELAFELGFSWSGDEQEKFDFARTDLILITNLKRICHSSYDTKSYITFEEGVRKLNFLAFAKTLKNKEEIIII